MFSSKTIGLSMETRRAEYRLFPVAKTYPMTKLQRERGGLRFVAE